MKIRLHSILLLVLIVFNPALLISQEEDSINLFDLGLEDLMNVKVITSSKIPEKILETPTYVHVITKEDIELLNFNTLEEVLEYLPGMSSINGEANFFTTTTIRGNTLVNYNTNTLLLYNGIPILNAYHGSFDLQAIPLSSIEKIEIIKGSNSVLYGSNAINAVINIISKEKTSWGNKNSSSNGKIKYGSYQTLHFQNSLNYNNNNIKFNLFTDINSSCGERLSYNDELNNTLQFNKNYKGSAVAANLKIKKLTFQFLYYDRSHEAVRTREFQRVYLSETDSVGTLITEPAKENMYVTAIEYFHTFSNKANIKLRSNYNGWKNIKYFPDGRWEYSSKGLYNEIEFTYNFSIKWKNLLGVNFNSFTGRRFKEQINDYDIGKGNTLTHEFAAYLNGNYEIFSNLNLFYGIRYYASKYNDVILENFSPRFALNFYPWKKLTMKLIYGQSFRIPTYFEKEVFSEQIIGNPLLKPEKSSSFDFVLVNITKKFHFEFNAFYSSIFDQIKRVDLPGSDNLKTNLNTGTSYYYGFEIYNKILIINKLNAFASYSYSQGVEDENSMHLPFTYKHMFAGGLNWKPNDLYGINSSFKYLDNWGVAPAYFLLNAGISISLSKNSPFMIELKVDNILNEKVLRPEIARAKPEVPTYPVMMSRYFYAGFSYKF